MRFTAVTLAWLHACAMFVWEVSAMDEYVASPRVNLEHEADDYDPPMSTTYDEMGFVRGVDVSTYGSTGTVAKASESNLDLELEMEPELNLDLDLELGLEQEIELAPERKSELELEPEPETGLKSASEPEALEAGGRKQATVRRETADKEKKQMGTAERLRRDTGEAPLEKEPPATVFDYYRPKPLDPVFVGGYWKRANPWENGRDGA